MSKPLIGNDGEVGELPQGFFQKATRGRPALPAEQRKQRVNVMLDPDVIERLKRDGKGWQTRLNATLRQALGL